MHTNAPPIEPPASIEEKGCPICYKFLNSDQLFGAVYVESCRGGICFQSGYAIEPGKLIYVFEGERPAAGPETTSPPGRLARVQWCENLPDLEAFFYHIAVVYL